MTAPQEVINFWFNEAAGKWFEKDDAFDELIRQRFLTVYEAASKGQTSSWRQTPEGRLAEVIVLDQFPRNMFRGTPEAFATDYLALQLALEAIEAGDDKKLNPTQRHFLYMPYMHSESKEVHKEAMRLFWSLPFWQWMALLYEFKHKRIIDRFGRYPHRNEILGRTSTPEEIAFMRSHDAF